MPATCPTPRHACDDHLRTEAAARLRACGYFALRTLTCEVAEGVVTLSGQVRSFYLKQVAQTVLLQLDGVQQVDNRVAVGHDG